jgi:NADPH:quinone reductase-like Zn-dependent oxidoreductase
MKSMRVAGTGQTPALIATDVPQPRPQKGEVLVRIHAAGITLTELAWFPTSHTKNGERRTGAVPVHEFSGEIAELGDGVEGLSVGQEVYGMNDWFAEGALAEYCITQPDWIAPKPRKVDYAEAASIPIGGLTAWQGLVGRAKLRAGERVLVHGGAGAVGIFVIQLAHLLDAYVIATASAHNLDFVKELGADEAVDYTADHFEDKVRNIDIVFDAVGGKTLERSWRVLNRNGRMVTIAADSEATSDERIKQAFFIVEPDSKRLAEIGNLIDAGDLRTVVDAVLPLSRASEAYAGTIERKGRGKIVVTVR